MKTLPDGLAESKERRRGAAALCLKIAASIWLKAQIVPSLLTMRIGRDKCARDVLIQLTQVDI